MNVLGEGPIGFAVHGIGFSEGNPTVTAMVACQGKQELRTFVSVFKVWYWLGRKLSAEEQEMLNEIWTKEKAKLGLPFDNEKKEG